METITHDSILNHILKDKITDSAEIEIHFFEYCNLACAFCGQDHDSLVGMSTVLNKIERVCSFIDGSSMSSFVVNMMGGELFNDEINDSLFADYTEFALAVHSHAAAAGKTTIVNWVTNLVFDNYQRVEQLISTLTLLGVNVNISTSYDFAGRPLTDVKKETFFINLHRFKNHIYTIGFVLTKQAIKRIMQNKDEVFEYLYANYPLYFDYYVPERLSQHMIPSDREHLDVFLYLAEHYPNVAPVSDWVKHEFNKMTCYSLNKLTLLPDGEEVTCRYLKYDEEDFNTPVDYKSNANIIQSHLDTYGCLSCEHYNRCSFRCFVQADWSNRERMDTCLYKEFFNIILDPSNNERYNVTIRGDLTK